MCHAGNTIFHVIKTVKSKNMFTMVGTATQMCSVGVLCFDYSHFILRIFFFFRRNSIRAFLRIQSPLILSHPMLPLKTTSHRPQWNRVIPRMLLNLSHRCFLYHRRRLRIAYYYFYPFFISFFTERKHLVVIRVFRKDEKFLEYKS